MKRRVALTAEHRHEQDLCLSGPFGYRSRFAGAGGDGRKGIQFWRSILGPHGEGLVIQSWR